MKTESIDPRSSFNLARIIWVVFLSVQSALVAAAFFKQKANQPEADFIFVAILGVIGLCSATVALTIKFKFFDGRLAQAATECKRHSDVTERKSVFTNVWSQLFSNLIVAMVFCEVVSTFGFVVSQAGTIDQGIPFWLVGIACHGVLYPRDLEVEEWDRLLRE